MTPIHIRSVTGRLINLAEFLPEDVEFEAIARGLAHVCRFAGQISVFYSVAQHSVLVSDLMPHRLKWAALMHDASEAYLGDLTRTLKHHPSMGAFRAIEKQVQHTIEVRYNFSSLTADDRALIKAGDDLAVIFEHMVLRRGEHWSLDCIRRALDMGYTSGRSSTPVMTALAAQLPPLWLALSADHAYDYFKGAAETLRPAGA